VGLDHPFICGRRAARGPPDPLVTLTPHLRFFGAIALILNACVVGAPVRPRAAEIAAGPPPPREAPSAARIVYEETAGLGADPDSSAEERPRPRPEAIWVDGYYHFNGVEYEWQKGRWEQRAPGYTCRAAQPSASK
jgi:hypothetical protein